MTQSPNSFDRLIQSIDRIDTIRNESAQIEQALGSADRDKVLVEKLMATYQQQGIELDRAMVEKAVSQTLPTRALAIPQPGHPLAHTLARIWLNRSTWVKPLAVGSTLAGLGLALVMGASMIADRIDANRLELAASNTTRIVQQVDAALAASAQVKVELPVQEDLIDAAAASLQQAQASLQQAKTVAAGTGDAGDLHEPISRLNEKASRELANATSAITLARQVPTYARQLDQLRVAMSQGTGWPQLDEVISQRLTQAQALVSDPQAVSGLPAAVSDLNALASAAAQRAVLMEAAKTVPGDGAEQAASLVATGEAALLRGNLDEANQSIDRLRDLTRLGAASYTLRITNEPNERTGVWRHHSDSPNARNHYIVVDAIDATGNPVELPIINEETGQRHNVSRFAVRVPESVYQQVGADKTDNGLVDNNVFGTKKPGTLETKYAFDVDGGMITNW